MRGVGDLGCRRLLVALIVGALPVAVTGCGSPDLLDPTEEQLAADRDRLVDLMTRGLMAAGDQLGAGSVLATRTDTSCSQGTNDWKIHDTYRSTCDVEVTGAFALDVGVEEALGGIEGLTAFEERLQAEGWGGGDWDVVRDDSRGLTVAEIVEDERPVTDVTGVEFYNNGANLRIGFTPGSEPVEPGYGPPSGYYTESQGTDWQDVWNAERNEHTLRISVFAYATLAEQAW